MDTRTAEFIEKSGFVPHSDSEFPVKFFIPEFTPHGLFPGCDITYVYNDDCRFVPKTKNHLTGGLYENGSGLNRIVSIRDETNSFTPYPPTTDMGELQYMFDPITKNRHLTILKVRNINFGLRGNHTGQEAADYRRDFLNAMISKEEAIAKFEVKSTSEQKARIEALKTLADIQDASGRQHSCYGLYIQIDLDKLNEGVGHYFESFNQLIRVEELMPCGRRSVDFTAERGFMYAHPWSETDDFETLYERVDNVKKNYLTTKFKIISSDNRYADTIAFSVQYDKISEIPIKKPDHDEEDGIYFYRHEPVAKETERETVSVIPLDQAATMGIFFNYQEACGHQQIMQSKRTIDEDTRRAAEAADHARKIERDLRQRDQDLKEADQRFKEAELRRKEEDMARAAREAETARQDAAHRRAADEQARTLEAERKAREDEMKRKIEVLRLTVQTVGAIGAIAAAAVTISKVFMRASGFIATPLTGLSILTR